MGFHLVLMNMNFNMWGISQKERALYYAKCPAMIDFAEGKLTFLQMLGSKITIESLNEYDERTRRRINWSDDAKKLIGKPIWLSELKRLFSVYLLGNMVFKKDYEAPEKENDDIA